MILDLERVASGERMGGDEVVVVRDVWGEENRIRCHVELTVRTAGDNFYLHADLSGVFETACHRCLEPMSLELTPSFDLVVHRTNPRTRQEPAEVVAEDFVTVPAGQSRLDLDPYVYENLVVSIPMKLVCSDECKGLCPSCGANLNQTACECESAEEPHWNELRKLKEID